MCLFFCVFSKTGQNITWRTDIVRCIKNTQHVLAWENTLCSTHYNHRAQQWVQSSVVLLLQTAALEGKWTLCVCWKICLFVSNSDLRYDFVPLATYDMCYVVGLICPFYCITATYARAYCSTITMVTTPSRLWAPDTAIRWCKVANCAPNKKLQSYQVLSWTFCQQAYLNIRKSVQATS